MSRCYKIIASLFLSTICFANENIKYTSLKDLNQTLVEENMLLLKATSFELLKDNSLAINAYKELYKKSSNPIYLKNFLKLSLNSNLIQKEIKPYLDEAIKIYKDDDDFIRIYASYAMVWQDYDLAISLISPLLLKENSEKNIEIMGLIYKQKKDFKTALKYFEQAYKKNDTQTALINISNLLAQDMKDLKGAQKYLETYISKNDCDINICGLLIDVYSKQGNLRGIVDIYIKLYKQTNNDFYAEHIMNFLLERKSYFEAVYFLEQTGYSPDFLMDFYASNKMFSKGLKIATKRYEESQNPFYLGMMAIFEFELIPNDKKNKDTIQPIIDKFEKVVNKIDVPMFFNNYGYTLIDYDIDIKKGIELIKKALKLEPESIFYQDSLAWGYYKLGDCKKAYEIIEPITSKTQEKEILEHLNKIKKCLNEKER